MDSLKIGKLIYKLRKDKKLTQQQLADQMNITGNAVSKWERGNGCPDVSLLPQLSLIFGVNLEELLSGQLGANDPVGGNMKKMKFYVCEDCGNLITSTAEAAIYCCGKKLEALTPKKVKSEEKLQVEIIENEYFISTSHEMTKEHFISFVALVTGDSIMLRKQYPEWNIQTRIPRFGRGMIMWYCTKHGLMYQLV